MSQEQALKEKRIRIRSAGKRMVWVTFQKEGIHCYPAAATDPNLNTNEIQCVVSFNSTSSHLSLYCGD